MSFKEVQMWTVVCDCCGEEADYGDYSAWADQGCALETAEGFAVVGDEHLCGACWCWPEDLPDYPGDEAWEGSDDEVRRHPVHPGREVGESHG